VADGQRSELFASAIEKWIAADHESACPQLGQGCKNGIEVTYGASIQHMELQPKRARGRLQLARYGFGIGDGGRVNEQCNASRRRYQLMQQLHPLRPYLRCQRCYAREIAARSGEAGDKARRDWVIAGGEDDRNGCRRSLCCQHCRRTIRGNHSHLAPGQIGYQRRKLIILAVGPAIFNRHVASLVVAGFA
jgi:hypothetical protein